MSVSLQDSIRQTICETMLWPLEDVECGMRLSDRQGWDSVNQLRALMAIETVARTKIPIKRFLACNTIDDISALVSEAQQKKAKAS